MQFKSLADLTWKDAAAGSLQATFSTLGGPPDRDGDITLASAFQDGSRVPLCWSHKWDQPIGDGTIRVLPDRAVFDGQFWLDTIDGEQAYKKVKRAGDLQDYSYGFQILDSAAGIHDGQPVRILKSLEVFEVSPVLVGAGLATGTDRIKEAAPTPDPLAQLQDAVLELKVGRRFSAASRREIQAAIDALSTLIAEIAADAEDDHPANAGPPELVELAARFRRIQSRHDPARHVGGGTTWPI